MRCKYPFCEIVFINLVFSFLAVQKFRENTNNVEIQFFYNAILA